VGLGLTTRRHWQFLAFPPECYFVQRRENSSPRSINCTSAVS
jgi:hypothetical protein